MNTQRAPEVSQEAVVEEIRKYCTICWKNARMPFHEWEDATQEVFARLLETLPRERWSEVFDENDDRESPHREFLRAIDAMKKRSQRARRHVSIGGDIADKQAPTADDAEEVRHMAEELSANQRRIILLVLEGNTSSDIIDITGRPRERVYDEKHKAIRKLRALAMLRLGA